MFQFLKRLHYFKQNYQLEPIPEDSQLLTKEYEYQRFKDLNEDKLNKIQKLFLKIRRILKKIKYILSNLFKEMMGKKSE